MARVLIKIDGESYKTRDGFTFKREYGQTPTGVSIGGKWTYRNPQGVYIGHDKYRHDLAKRHSLKFA